MAPKKKEEERESCVALFTFDDGSVYEGHFIKKDNFLEATQPVSGGRTPTVTVAKISTGSYSLDRAPSLVTTIPHGTGTFRDSTGAVYDGQWLDGKMSGLGTLTFPSGCYYKGDFLGNQYHGVGKYGWPDGSYYTGEWRQGKMHGNGIYLDTSGRCWHGSFTEGSCTSAVCEQVF